MIPSYYNRINSNTGVYQRSPAGTTVAFGHFPPLGSENAPAGTHVRTPVLEYNYSQGRVHAVGRSDGSDLVINRGGPRLSRIMVSHRSNEALTQAGAERFLPGYNVSGRRSLLGIPTGALRVEFVELIGHFLPPTTSTSSSTTGKYEIITARSNTNSTSSSSQCVPHTGRLGGSEAVKTESVSDEQIFGGWIHWHATARNQGPTGKPERIQVTSRSESVEVDHHACPSQGLCGITGKDRLKMCQHGHVWHSGSLRVRGPGSSRFPCACPPPSPSRVHVSLAQSASDPADRDWQWNAGNS
eukprot:2510844-Rhodomonas_salina.3